MFEVRPKLGLRVFAFFLLVAQKAVAADAFVDAAGHLFLRPQRGGALGEQLRHGLRLDQLARLLEVVIDDGFRVDAERVVHRGE